MYEFTHPDPSQKKAIWIYITYRPLDTARYMTVCEYVTVRSERDEKMMNSQHPEFNANWKLKPLSALRRPSSLLKFATSTILPDRTTPLSNNKPSCRNVWNLIMSFVVLSNVIVVFSSLVGPRDQIKLYGTFRIKTPCHLSRTCDRPAAVPTPLAVTDHLTTPTVVSEPMPEPKKSNFQFLNLF